MQDTATVNQRANAIVHGRKTVPRLTHQRVLLGVNVMSMGVFLVPDTVTVKTLANATDHGKRNVPVPLRFRQKLHLFFLAIGNDRDDHGCITSAGYSYCKATDKCYRP